MVTTFDIDRREGSASDDFKVANRQILRVSSLNPACQLPATMLNGPTLAANQGADVA